MLLYALCVRAHGHVVKANYGIARTGHSKNETTLRPANINANHFGRLFRYSADGYIPIDTLGKLEPPVISAVAISGVTANSVTISWTTNKAADTQVDYGRTTSYGSLAALNSAPVTRHSALLNRLQANTVYHFRVKSRDAAGNLATSADSTFTTALWSASMETGDMSEWGATDNRGGEFNSGNAVDGASKDVAHTGQFSAKLTIMTANADRGASGVRLFRWGQPQDYPQLYYSTWYYFPYNVSVANWWNIMQWKSKHTGASGSDPFYALNVANRPDGSMYLYLYDTQRRVSYSPTVSVSLPTSKWTQIEAFYSCSGDNSGHLAIWQDGALLFDLTNQNTRFEEGDCQWSVNNYSDQLSPSPVTIYIDDAAISLTRIGP